MCEHGPQIYKGSKEWVGKHGRSLKRKSTSPPETNQNDEPQTGAVETEGEKEAESRMGTETV